eukprot:scaffold25040_cov130-Isochrysis_galbana.AAC.1
MSSACFHESARLMTATMTAHLSQSSGSRLGMRVLQRPLRESQHPPLLSQLRLSTTTPSGSSGSCLGLAVLRLPVLPHPPSTRLFMRLEAGPEALSSQAAAAKAHVGAL